MIVHQTVTADRIWIVIVDQIVTSLEKVLSIVPCHRKKDRCLAIRGYIFPLCARCTGILAGYLALPFLLIMDVQLSIVLGVLLNVPMAADGWTQKMGLRVSNNALRLVTGVLCGAGQSVLIVGVSRWIISAIG